MLQKETLKFLKELKKNNNKAWFELHRKDYDQAKLDLTGMVSKLIETISRFDAPIGSLQAKDCLFRINRDVRFSKDKSPYKTNMAAYFNKGGKKSNGAGYYLHIEPGKSMVAGGMWMPLPADLAKIRQEIDYGFADWKKFTGSANFKKYFPGGVIADSSLSRPPKGYDEQNPAIGFLKMKSFIVSRPIGDAEITDKAFVTNVAQTFRAMKPLIDFLNQAID
ncbi:MAG: DUF2461 domain-containing protein [Chitinophagaceae bacterium]|nr:DUF2461 domain-containing protein [Chitinophagaceae bacterium]